MPSLLPIFLLPLILLPIYLILSTTRKSPKNTPPGSFGIPFIGQSLSLLWAMRANTADEWIAGRARRYGAVSFVFSGDGNKLSNQQTDSVRMVLGDRCLLELVGEDHKRIRNALSSFLKPDSLKDYIGKMGGRSDDAPPYALAWEEQSQGYATNEDADIQHNMLTSVWC
ncbi:taxoid 14-beta-hydroxylase-like [Salvia splendens]|uniref:taxoid 14-beta-hydroxylase-like n=1 Tax=Salvia splendens TaxID=180675 RepID=UPI001C257B42|nr:taxoid 14-beta-hydroxylase-like [Salvia splendens]